MTNDQPAVGAQTNTGLVRSNNEDSWDQPHRDDERFAATNGYLFAVADGVGGEEAGELASKLAVETLYHHYYKSANQDPQAALRDAFFQANDALRHEAATRQGVAGMATTLTAVVILGDEAFVAHVGDSRAYLVGPDEFVPLTNDHTVAMDLLRNGTITREQYEQHERRHTLSRWLNYDDASRPFSVDLSRIDLTPGCRIVLCTDGLTDLVLDATIQEFASTMNPQDAADALVQRALLGGGHDNVTVVVVEPSLRSTLIAAAPTNGSVIATQETRRIEPSSAEIVQPVADRRVSKSGQRSKRPFLIALIPIIVVFVISWAIKKVVDDPLQQQAAQFAQERMGRETAMAIAMATSKEGDAAAFAAIVRTATAEAKDLDATKSALDIRLTAAAATQTPLPTTRTLVTIGTPRRASEPALPILISDPTANILAPPSSAFDCVRFVWKMEPSTALSQARVCFGETCNPADPSSPYFWRNPETFSLPSYPAQMMISDKWLPKPGPGTYTWAVFWATLSSPNGQIDEFGQASERRQFQYIGGTCGPVEESRSDEEPGPTPIETPR